MLKAMLWIVCGLIVLGLSLYKGCMNSLTESSSPTSVSWSPSDAKERNKYIRPVRIVPNSFNWKGQEVVIDSAWIERERRVHYYLLFFKSYEYFDNYRVVFTIKDMQKFEDSTLGFTSPHTNGMGTQSSGRSKRYVYMGFLGTQYPDTIPVAVTDRFVQTDTLAFIPM